MKIQKTLILGLLSLAVLISCSEEEPLTFDQQLAKDIKKIEKYLDENSITAERDDTGVFYVIHEQGSGDSPSFLSDVKVKYAGRIMSSGKEFDNSDNYPEYADGATFTLSTLIPAWQIMLPQLNEGGNMTMYAPSVFCYGQRSVGTIKANSNLIFDIELLEVNPDEVD